MELVESPFRQLALEVGITEVLRWWEAITIHRTMIRRTTHRTRIRSTRAWSRLNTGTLLRRNTTGRVAAQRLMLWRRQRLHGHGKWRRLLMTHGLGRVAHRLRVTSGHGIVEGVRRIGCVVRGTIARNGARRFVRLMRKWRRGRVLEVRRRRIVSRMALVLRRARASALATGGGVARTRTRSLVIQGRSSSSSSRNRCLHRLRQLIRFRLTIRSMLAAAAVRTRMRGVMARRR